MFPVIVAFNIVYILYLNTTLGIWDIGNSEGNRQ